MRIGIPIWNGRVSPVLDTAERVVVIDSGDETGEMREEVVLQPRRLPLRAARIAELHLDLLVCGAVSRPLAEMLAAAGVRLEPWIAGEVEEVLGALTTGQLDRPRYRMPGCCGGRGQGRGRGRSQGGRGGAQRRNR
ncbi:MAG: dinitrogenase iron-molybdenum cofactor biosynthesis protein [Candidatus Eisenbacteria bacterium]|nr:dinitrogenase iron-molybdenum cofactor biosynthesis protein [Candidatus Eisenbacteria bacterium]